MSKEKGQFLDKKLMAQIKEIHLRAKHIVNDSFAGEYQSAFRGRGMEFDEIREYTAGDDVRNIDWNVTARTHKPYVKVFKDERELTVLFAVDISGSSQFGSAGKLKKDMMAEITALFAFAALKNNDKAGLLIFSDTIHHFIPPKKGSGHSFRIIKDILTYQAKAKGTNLSLGLDYINRILKQKVILFLISDFLTPGFENSLRVSARRHDVVAIKVSDPLEEKIPSVGYIEWEDLETGKSILINTGHLLAVQNFEKRMRTQNRKLKDFFRGIDIDYIHLRTDKPYIADIIQFFRNRERKMR